MTAPASGPGTITAPADTPEWHRLHPLSPLILGGARMAGLVPVVAVAVYAGGGLKARIPDVVVVAVLIVAYVIRWLVTRWALDGTTLRIETGLLRRDSRQLPVSRIQAVDVVKPLLARILGLAELRIRLAGSSDRADGRLAYLSDSQADGLRARLLATTAPAPARAEAPENDAGELPEYPITALPAGRLIGASVLSVAVPLVILGAAYTALTLTTRMDATWGVLPVTILLAIAGTGWRRVQSSFGFTAAISPDGVRIRRGLLSTVAETIPIRRIQAVRMTQPLLWRPFGWARLQVDVAGHAGHDEGSREVRKNLLPVGPVAEARHLAQLVLGHQEPQTRKPPRKARAKGPLSYHFLTAGHDDTMAVTSTGRLVKETTWMRLEKIQSVRFVQGPVQRRLGLATVHADAAGKHVHATFRDRTADEAKKLTDELAALSRVARNT